MAFILPFIALLIALPVLIALTNPAGIARAYDKIFKLFRTSMKDVFGGKHEKHYVVTISLIVLILLGWQLQNAIEYSAYEIGTDPGDVAFSIPPNSTVYLGVSYWHKVEDVWYNVDTSSVVNAYFIDLNNPDVRHKEVALEPGENSYHWSRTESLPYIWTRLGVIADWRIALENPSESVYAQVNGFIGRDYLLMTDPPPRYVAPILLQIPMEFVDVVLIFAFLIPSIVIHKSGSRRRLEHRDAIALFGIAIGIFFLQIGVAILRSLPLELLWIMIPTMHEPLFLFYSKVVLIVLSVWFYGSKRPDSAIKEENEHNSHNW
ncbi:MAG: hypothetical protein ACXAEF_09275 [Candidatus Thorarchaeota archaeon]|jgi:hypothetical protein